VIGWAPATQKPVVVVSAAIPNAFVARPKDSSAPARPMPVAEVRAMIGALTFGLRVLVTRYGIEMQIDG